MVEKLDACLKSKNIDCLELEVEEEEVNIDHQKYQTIQASWAMQELLKNILCGDKDALHKPYWMD